MAASPQFLKSALRDLLSVSYDMKSITVISHLRWLPPFGALRHHLPPGIGRATKVKRLYGQARRLTSPDLHILCRMCTVDNKAPQSNPFTQRIAKNKVPPPGGRWWRQPPKGVHFRRPQGGCKGFIQTGAFYIFRGAHHNPRARGASNLSPLRTFGPAGRQPLCVPGRLYGFIILAPSINLEAPTTTLAPEARQT